MSKKLFIASGLSLLLAACGGKLMIASNDGHVGFGSYDQMSHTQLLISMVKHSKVHLLEVLHLHKHSQQELQSPHLVPDQQQLLQVVIHSG